VTGARALRKGCALALAIPRHRDDVTPAWLTRVLAGTAEAVVGEVDIVAVGTGQTGATYRVAVRYDANPAALPGTFIIKLPATDDAVRDRVALGYRSECAFYRSVASRVKIPVPQCFYGEIAEDGSTYALLLADQAPAVQGDQLAGCDEGAARLAARAIAGLHAPTWCQPEWIAFPGMVMSFADDASRTGIGDIAAMSARITVDRLAGKLSGTDAETLIDSMSLVTPWLCNDFGRFSVIHGDFRLDNVLFHPDRRGICLVDWQTLGVGLPARDLAYFTSTSLTPELRTDIEHALVADYRDALCEYGVTGYDLETCWHDYRYGMLQALLTSALGFAFSVTTDRGDDMVATMLARGCRAMRELGTADLIREAAGIA
jgi:Phosphotransferase enzyme family